MERGLILDVQEGLAREESVVTTRETAAESTRQRAVSELNEAFELLDRRMRLKYSESNTKSNTDTASKSFTYAKEWWVLCTSIQPATDDWEAWSETLPKDYDHVSCDRSTGKGSPKHWRTWSRINSALN